MHERRGNLRQPKAVMREVRSGGKPPSPQGERWRHMWISFSILWESGTAPSLFRMRIVQLCICCLQVHQMNPAPTSLRFFFPLLPALSFPESFVTFSRNSRPARRKSVPEPISPSSPVLPLSPIQLEGKINYDLPGDQLDSGWHVFLVVTLLVGERDRRRRKRGMGVFERL